MSENIHTQVYQRFFAVLFSVIPGVNVVLGVSALVLWLLADIVEIEWGWAVGVAAIVLSLLFVGWIILGIGIQKWAEEKPTGALAGMCAPFLIVDAILMGWLFVDVVIIGPEEAEAASEGARVLVETLQFLV